MITLVSMLAGAGCVAPRASRVAAVPPAPQAAPPAPPEAMPISIVQNAAALPPAQPVPPEALPPLDPPEPVSPRPQPADAADAAKKRAPGRKTAENAAPVPAPAATPAAVSAAQPPASLVGSDENLPGRSALAAKIKELKLRVAHIAQAGVSGAQRPTFHSIESFVKLAERALSRGDLRQAGELADRAATLARALQP